MGGVIHVGSGLAPWLGPPTSGCVAQPSGNASLGGPATWRGARATGGHPAPNPDSGTATGIEPGGEVCSCR
jgi:hypothetical protein